MKPNWMTDPDVNKAPVGEGFDDETIKIYDDVASRVLDSSKTAALCLSEMLVNDGEQYGIADCLRSSDNGLAVCEKAVHILHRHKKEKSAGVRKYLGILREQAAQFEKEALELEKRTEEKRSELVEKAVSGGVLDCFKLAKWLEKSGKEQESGFWFCKAAEGGHRESQFLTGMQYLYGKRGIKNDYSVAMEWFRKAAARGHPRAKEHVEYFESKLEKPEEKRCLSQQVSWPSDNSGEEFSGDIRISEVDWRELSPLTAMGYHVGRIAGVSDSTRRDILMSILYGALCFPEGFSNEEREEWGRPGSASRLQKIVTHINQNILLRRNLKNMKDAVADWESDLKWLELRLRR